MFHQVEGLVVDRGITLADLKGTLELFCRALFGPTLDLRFRPGYFPFTEPSAEVDISCFMCRAGPGLPRLQAVRAGWRSWARAWSHPQVLSNVRHRPGEVLGLAFGMGIERVAMIKFGVPDLRLLLRERPATARAVRVTK